MPVLRVVADGGNCCGLKHIYGFGNSPTTRCAAYRTLKGRQTAGIDNPYGCQLGGDHGHRDKDATYVDLPEQTAEQRFYDLVETIRKNGLKRHLIQCTLVDGYGHGSDGSPDWEIHEAYLDLNEWYHQRQWYPIMEKAGFKQVNRWMNSNSSNYVTCWQLVMCPDWEKEWLEKKLFTKEKKEEPEKAKAAPFG